MLGNIDYGHERIDLAVYTNESEEGVRILMTEHIHNTEAEE